MKSLTLSVLLLACSFASAQVTYKTTGATVAKVIADVSAKTGEKLTVHEDLAREVVVVSVNDMPLQTFKEKLAQCTSGAWIRLTDNSAQLVDDKLVSEGRRLESQRLFAKNIPWLIDRALVTNQQSSRRDFFMGGMDTVYYRIAKQIPPEVLVDLLPGSIIVLSSNPNQLQRRAPDIFDMYEQTRQAQHNHDVAIAQTFGNRPEEFEPNKLASYRIVLQRESIHGISMSFTGIDAKGELFTTAGLDLPSPGIRPVPTTGQKIEWSAMTSELYSANRGTNIVGKDANRFSAALTRALRDPVKWDPISFFVGEGLFAYASSRKLNLVACVPDHACQVGSAYYVHESGLTTDGFFSKLEDAGHVGSRIEDGTLVVYPRDPIYARNARLDRTTLKRLIERKGGRFHPTLDDLAAFAIANPQSNSIPYSAVESFEFMLASEAIGESAHYFYTQPRSWQALQFFGSLSKSEKTKLISGELIPFQRLKPASKRTTERYLFGTVSESKGSQSKEITDVLKGDMADLSVRAKVEQVYAVWPNPETRRFKPMDRQDIVSLRGMRRRIFPDEPIDPLERVQLGWRTKWSIEIRVGEKTIRWISLHQDNFERGGRVITVAELPLDVKELLGLNPGDTQIRRK